MPEKLANSGTIARGLAQAAVPAAAGAAYGLYQGDYVDALKGAAFGIAAGGCCRRLAPLAQAPARHLWRHCPVAELAGLWHRLGL